MAHPEAAWPELQSILDEELNLLPATSRLPLILCYLQGKPPRQIAAELGWPADVVPSRLARARELLRANLARRGVVLSGTVLARLLDQQGPSGVVPLSLLHATIRGGLLFAAGKAVAGVVSAHALSLAQGILLAMALTKRQLDSRYSILWGPG
jgi:hypothetical protein